MAFRDRLANAEETPDASEVEAAPAATEETPTATPAAGLSLVGITPTQSLTAAIDGTLAATKEGTGGGPLYPTVQQNGGQDARGALAPLKGTDEALAEVLPEGTRPVHCVLLGFRWEYTAWKWPYQEVPEGEDLEDAKYPAYSFALPATAVNDIALANKAASKYQFTKKAERVKFNFRDSQCGHLLPTVRMLCFWPDLNDLMVVSTPNTLDAGENLISQFRGLLDSNGVLQPQPVKIKPGQVTKPRSGYQYWTLQVTGDAGEDAAEAWAGYQEWVAQNREDEAVIGQYTEWVNGTDMPINDAIRTYLGNFPTVAAS